MSEKSPFPDGRIPDRLPDGRPFLGSHADRRCYLSGWWPLQVEWLSYLSGLFFYVLIPASVPPDWEPEFFYSKLFGQWSRVFLVKKMRVSAKKEG